MLFKAIFFVLLGFSLFECSAYRAPEPEFHGVWEGRTSSGHIEAILTIREDRIRIEFLTEPVSTLEHRYESDRVGERLRIAVEGIDEPLWVLFDTKGNMHFDVTGDSQRKVDVPRLTTLTFSRPF